MRIFTRLIFLIWCIIYLCRLTYLAYVFMSYVIAYKTHYGYINDYVKRGSTWYLLDTSTNGMCMHPVLSNTSLSFSLVGFLIITEKLISLE